MNELVNVKNGLPSNFKPEEALENDAKADAIISMAKAVKDWPLLETAVEKKMGEQAAFVAWWDENVRAKGERSNVTDLLHLKAEDATKMTGIGKMQVSRWRARLKQPENYKAMLYGAAYNQAMSSDKNTIATKHTGDPESYTPQKYIDAARKVMGSIDLDPASNNLAQEVVQATRWFGIEENGLQQSWGSYGNVWMNPPYKQPEMSLFADKLCTEFVDGNIKQAIMLTNNNTDTHWFHKSAKVASAVCFTLGRINFYKADGMITQPTNGQAFFYFGNNVESFVEVFADIGTIMR